MKTASLAVSLLAALIVLAFRPAAGAAGLAVDLRNDESRSLSVPAGSDNGITLESDFEVQVGKDQAVPVFPAEIFKNRFWSAPLSPEDFEAIRTGMPVKPFAADKTTHKLMRKIAAEYAKQIGQEKASSRRWEQLKQAADLKERRSRLLAEKEKLDGWIADATRDIAGEQEKARSRADSAEQDIARAQQRIDDLTDQRNEAQSQRDALPREDRAGRNRLTTQVTSLNGRLSSERDSLRSAQDRKRDSTVFLQREKRDKRTLSADRDKLSVEIKAIDRQIAELSAQ